LVAEASPVDPVQPPAADEAGWVPTRAAAPGLGAAGQGPGPQPRQRAQRHPQSPHGQGCRGTCDATDPRGKCSAPPRRGPQAAGRARPRRPAPRRPRPRPSALPRPSPGLAARPAGPGRVAAEAPSGGTRPRAALCATHSPLPAWPPRPAPAGNAMGREAGKAGASGRQGGGPDQDGHLACLQTLISYVWGQVSDNFTRSPGEKQRSVRSQASVINILCSGHLLSPRKVHMAFFSLNHWGKNHCSGAEQNTRDETKDASFLCCIL
jgi:hypothetical protein